MLLNSALSLIVSFAAFASAVTVQPLSHLTPKTRAAVYREINALDFPVSGKFTPINKDNARAAWNATLRLPDAYQRDAESAEPGSAQQWVYAELSQALRNPAGHEALVNELIAQDEERLAQDGVDQSALRAAADKVNMIAIAYAAARVIASGTAKLDETELTLEKRLAYLSALHRLPLLTSPPKLHPNSPHEEHWAQKIAYVSLKNREFGASVLHGLRTMDFGRPSPEGKVAAKQLEEFLERTRLLSEQAFHDALQVNPVSFQDAVQDGMISGTWGTLLMLVPVFYPSALVFAAASVAAGSVRAIFYSWAFTYRKFHNQQLTARIDISAPEKRDFIHERSLALYRATGAAFLANALVFGAFYAFSLMQRSWPILILLGVVLLAAQLILEPLLIEKDQLRSWLRQPFKRRAGKAPRS